MGEFFIIPTLFFIGVSFLIVRAASIALMMTGLDEKRARFQALSAFSGTGFTTKEAELVVNHHQRRRIVMWLMILGNAGIVTVIVTGTSTIVVSDGYHLAISAVILVLGTFIVYKILSRNAVVRRWEKFIEHRLIKSRAFEEVAAEDLLHLGEGYGLLRVIAKLDSPFLNAQLSELQSGDERIWVLGIERSGTWIPFPPESTQIVEDDRFVVYGHLATLNRTFREVDS